MTEILFWFLTPSSGGGCLSEMENDPRFKKLLVEDRNKAMDFVKFSVQNDRNAAHVRQLVVGSIGFVAGFLVAILAS